MTMHRRIEISSTIRAGLLALVIVGLALGLASSADAQLPDLLPIPDVEFTDDVESAVQEVFPQLREAIDQLEANSGTNASQLAEAYGELGRAALYYETSAVIEPALINAQRLDPEDYRWPYYLGAYYQDQRRLEEATDQLEIAHQLQPDNAAINVRLGQLALLSDRPEQAPEYFEKATGSDGFAALALYGLGRSASLRGDDAAALELYKAALELQPEAAEVHQQMGLAYRKLGDMDAAREHLSKQASGSLSFPDPLMDSLRSDFSRSHLFAGLEAQSTGRWEEAVAEYRKAVNEDPTNGVNHQILADALEKSGDLDSAIEEFRLAASLLPSDGMVRVQLAKALVARDGVSDEAVAVFSRAVEMAPKLKEAQKGLAGALLQQQRFEEALEHLEAALDIDPGDLSVRLQLARILILFDQPIQAVAELEKVLAAAPRRPEVLLNYGQALALIGRWAEARATLEKLLEQPATDSVRALAHKELAGLSRAEGQEDRVLEQLQLAADLAPEMAAVMLELAQALGVAGRYGEAVSTYDTVLMSDPQNEEARLGQARALAAGGEIERAQAQLESILTARPDAVEAAVDLAAIEARQGDFDAAIARLEGLLASADDDNSRAILNFEIGGLKQLAGDDEAALQYYEAAIEQAPALRDAQFNRAVSLGRLGRQAEAEDQLRQVLEIDPQDERSYLALAQALAGSGQFADSRQVLQDGLDEVVESKLLMAAMVQLLLASPDPETRDAAAAVPLATRLHEIDPSVQNGAMVAAALGASGRSAEAAEWQARVLRQAEAAGWPQEQLQRMRSDLALYRQRAGGG